MAANPDWTNRPSLNTDPTPGDSERAIDGLLRAAANLAPVVIPGDVGEQLRLVFWTYYNTDTARRFEPLARAVVNARPKR